MNLFRSLASTRSDPALSMDDWSSFFSLNGLSYPLSPTTTMGERTQEISDNFVGYVQGAYKANGVVFACMLARQLLFSEARFQYRTIRSGRPGKLFGNESLRPLETPEPNKTTCNLLTRMIQDADLSGNWYGRRLPNGIQRLRPDWVTIVMGSMKDPAVKGGDLDAELLGYIYQPGGPGSGRDPVVLLREEVAHFAPIPDPLATYRGMSWLTPIVRELMADQAATTHKLKYLENGATPNMIVSLDPAVSAENFEKWTALFESKYGSGMVDAYKTWYLGGGAEATVVGSNLKEISFKETQGGGETRIAAAARIPAIIVGLSEGLEASTYSNFSQARRAFADGTLRPLWRDAAASLATIIKVPAGAELWYDDRDISFLQEDIKDRAEIQVKQSTAIKLLVDSGYEPDAVIAAIQADDMQLLSGNHTGLFSVQLQPPGTNAPAPASPVPEGTNGFRRPDPARELLAGLLE